MFRQNNKTGEFVLFFEKKVGNETIRASARIQMNEIDPIPGMTGNPRASESKLDNIQNIYKPGNIRKG